MTSQPNRCFLTVSRAVESTIEVKPQDRDGFMTLDDLRRGLADPQMRGLNLAQLMDDLDRNQDGRLEYTEFIAAAMDQKLHENEAIWIDLGSF